MVDGQKGVVADRDHRGVRLKAGSREYTRGGRHVGCGAGVEVPLGAWWSSGDTGGLEAE